MSRAAQPSPGQAPSGHRRRPVRVRRSLHRLQELGAPRLLEQRRGGGCRSGDSSDDEEPEPADEELELLPDYLVRAAALLSAADGSPTTLILEGLRGARAEPEPALWLGCSGKRPAGVGAVHQAMAAAVAASGVGRLSGAAAGRG